MSILEQWRAFLDDDEWRYSELSNIPAFKMGFSGDNGSWDVVVVVDEDDVVTVQSMLNQKVPEKRRDEAAILFARINWNVRIGAFKLDMSDGEVRYVSTFDAEGMELPRLTLKNLLYSNLVTTDKYFPAVMAVAYAQVDAFSALLNLEE